MAGAAHTWGSTEEERRRRYPCDVLLQDPDDELYRAIDIDAPTPLLFRWLCQLRLAPYSYDWIDNLGRRSPRSLTPGLERLETGQRVMTIFRLADFEPDRHLTVLTDRARWLFGEVACTYAVSPRWGGSRLVVKLVARYPRGRVALLRRMLPLGDLIMMRKQLRTLKQFAERDAAAV